MLRLLVTSLCCLLLVSAVCPPCPGPPVHACCDPSVQVEGACCQVSCQQHEPKRQCMIEFMINYFRLMRNVVFLLTTTFHRIVLQMMCANIKATTGTLQFIKNIF